MTTESKARQDYLDARQAYRAAGYALAVARQAHRDAFDTLVVARSSALDALEGDER